MRGDLLVAHVNDFDGLVDASVVDVDDVAATESENGVDALILQGPGDEVSTGDLPTGPWRLRRQRLRLVRLSHFDLLGSNANR